MDEEIVERWVRAHEEADSETLDELMDEEFVYEQAGFPKRLDKEEYLHLVEALHWAFPDLGVEAETEGASDGVVQWRQRLQATHERDLDLTNLGLPFFWSTGNTIQLSADDARTYLRDGLITEVAIEDPHAGLAGLLSEVETGVKQIREEARQHDPAAPGL